MWPRAWSSFSYKFLTTPRWVGVSACWKLGRLFGRMQTGWDYHSTARGITFRKTKDWILPSCFDNPLCNSRLEAEWLESSPEEKVEMGWTWTRMCPGRQEGQCLPGLYKGWFYQFPLVAFSIWSFRIKLWKSYDEFESHLILFHADKWSDTSVNLSLRSYLPIQSAVTSARPNFHLSMIF